MTNLEHNNNEFYSFFLWKNLVTEPLDYNQSSETSMIIHSFIHLFSV